jgi:kynurenine formamidase
MQIIDLSHEIHEGMPVYPGDPRPEIRRALSHEANGCHVDELRLGSHTGTHIDAPFHLMQAGRTLDAFAVERFVGPGVVIDVSARPALAPIGAPELAPAVPRIAAGDFVLLRTGWDRFFGAGEYLRHPFLSAEGARLLVDCGAGLVGIDAPSVDPSAAEAACAASEGKAQPGAAYPAHDILLGSGVLIVENLCRLDRVPAKGGVFVFLPLKLRGADGSPVRAVYFQP